ncbi:MAG: hypothetical protein ACLQM8_17670 [Limisphaerales bacterium]
MDAGYWKAISEKAERFPVLWNPETGTPVQYWVPEREALDARAKPDEIAVIPSDEPGFAIFLISARHYPATVRASFHTQLKRRNFEQWHPRCVEYWKTLTVEFPQLPRTPDGRVRIELDAQGYPIREKVIRRLFDPERHLPPRDKPAKSAARKDPWLGLAAFDVAREGLPLGKGSAEADFLLNHATDYNALQNAQRSATRRIEELDEIAGRLDKNLDHWIKESVRLKHLGLFDAAAGSDEP